MRKTETSNQKGSRKKVLLIAAAVATLVLLACVGVIAAFFSDVINSGGGGTTGTLNITGEYKFYVNGSETAVTAIGNLNPGDVIVAKASIENEGNKSAWVRDGIDFDGTDEALLPFISVYSGEKTLAQITAAPTDGKLTLNDGRVFSGNRVLDGSGEHAEVETEGSYDFIEASSYQAVFTIYFSTAADNSAQNKTLAFSAVTQALQYRNNNAAEPDADAWASVVTAAFDG